MKKIFVFLLLMVVSFALKAQYPIQQNLGGDSTIIYIKGAARTVGGFINGVYTDTTAANQTRIRQYQAAQIFTTSDSAIWIRTVGAKKWVRLGSESGGSGANIYNSDGSLTGNRILSSVGHSLQFTGLSNFLVDDVVGELVLGTSATNRLRISSGFTAFVSLDADSLLMTRLPQSQLLSTDSVIVRTADYKIKTRAVSSIGNIEPGNLKLWQTTGGTFWYTTPNGYSYSLDSLFYKEMAGTVTKDSQYIKPQVIPYPDGWTYKPVTIQRDNDGTISNTMTTDEFRHRYKLYGKTYYVDNAGSDSNDGLTPAAPLLTIGAALAKSDVVEISCDSGYYYQNSWAYYDTITKSVSIYCPNGKAIFGDAFKPTGFLYLTSDSADVWRAEAVTGGKVYGIDTVDVFGNPIIYTKVSSKAACNALERSYYSPQFGQPGYPNTYFNPPSSIGTPVQLDNVYVTAGNSGRYLLDSYGTSRDSLTLYLEGIEFIGAGEISRMTDGCKIYAQDCRFVGSTNSTDAFRTDYGEEVVLYNCNGGYSELDVFSYTATDKVAEISVNGIWAGIYGGVSNQVSTAHSATNIVRVNGDYRNSTTYILTDVNTNTKSFNVGIKTKGADSTNSIPYYTLDAANMYLVDCVDSSSTPDFTLAAGSLATIFIQNFKTDATNYSTTPQSNPLGYIKYYELSRNDSAGYFVEKINRVIKPIGTDSLFQYIDGLKYFIGLDETAAPAGTGITELNGLNATTQTFSSNTIDIISSGSNHAFELKYDTTAIVTFGAGSGADSDTTAFTTSAIYGSFYNDADTIVVTSFKAVLQGTSPDVTYKIWYNDSLNVEAGATALNTAGNQVTNTTTGTNVTSFDVTKIPPGVWVWVKTSTVATKPKYFSLTINGYRK